MTSSRRIGRLTFRGMIPTYLVRKREREREVYLIRSQI